MSPLARRKPADCFAPASPCAQSRLMPIRQPVPGSRPPILPGTGMPQSSNAATGGLDWTQALSVAARVMDDLGLPRANVLAYTLPGFATSEQTKANAWALMRALGVAGTEIDIRPAARQMLADLAHPFAGGAPV